MVFQKRSNFGFNGYKIPAMPRGCRSARGRRSVRRNVEKNEMCAFELLATVAGRLLLEEESKSSNLKGTVKQEQLEDDHKPFKMESYDQGSCDEGPLTWKHNTPPKECSQASTSGVVKEPKVVENSPKVCDPKLGNGSGTPLQVKKQKTAVGSDRIVSDVSQMEDSLDFDAKPPPLVSSDSSAGVPLYRHGISCGFIPKFADDMEMLDRDDDENSSGCTHPSTLTTKTFRSQNIGDRRIKKITASKFWKVGPTLLKDGEFYSNEVKPVFKSRKMCCTRQRTQRSSFKRKKLSVRSSVSSDFGICKEAICDPKSAGKGTKVETGGSDKNLNGANETWSPMASQKLPHKSEKVKFRVKSFKVPELFIEMPETATVGSLKRAVLESVSAMLENGLRVGLIFQGKRIWDDSKTLEQAGISDEDNLNTLGFTLEPNSSQPPHQLSCHEDPHFLHPCESPKPLARIPALPVTDSTLVVTNPDESPGAPATPPQADTYVLDHNTTPTSRALVTVPSTGDGPLVLIPSHHRKSKRSELVQRRIRRPFSVAEVEALVHAVEILGTGRWRDVKIRAFENAKHRTYVDLKDKWKTLVHTARISPQQRRGEPVPQELLDRVLKAHAHWSHHQAKLQTNKPHQQPETCLLL